MARPFKKILCPVDFSDSSLAALEYATEFARQNNGQLILLHVIENPLIDQYSPKEQNLHAAGAHAVEKSKQMLTDTARTYAAGIPYEVVATRGDPYEQIVDLASAQQADVIVMATHGHTGPRRLLIGSVTEKVVRAAACPVLTVRHGLTK